MLISKHLEPVKYEGKTLQAYPFTGSDAPPCWAHLCPSMQPIGRWKCLFRPSAGYCILRESFGSWSASSDRDVSVDRPHQPAMEWSHPPHCSWLLWREWYSSPNGTLLPNSINPTTGTLHPITDGTAATRRPAGVRFVKVCLPIDYSDIVQGGGSCTVNLDFYLKLPQGDVTFTTPTGVVQT